MTPCKPALVLSLAEREEIFKDWDPEKEHRIYKFRSAYLCSICGHRHVAKDKNHACIKLYSRGAEEHLANPYKARCFSILLPVAFSNPYFDAQQHLLDAAGTDPVYTIFGSYMLKVLRDNREELIARIKELSHIDPSVEETLRDY